MKDEWGRAWDHGFESPGDALRFVRRPKTAAAAKARGTCLYVYLEKGESAIRRVRDSDR